MASTIIEMFETQLKAGGHRAALRSKRGGRWTTATWDEWNRKSRAIAAALIGAGVAKGDRVAILSNTREEWVVADIAILMAGAITVPVYPTLTPDETVGILQDSGAIVVMAESPQAAEKFLRPGSGDPPHALRHVILFDTQSVRDIPNDEGVRVLSCDDLRRMTEVPVAGLSEFVSRGETLLEDKANVEALDARIGSVTADDLASIVYTAGAVGRHKGAMLTHRNFCFQVESAPEVLDLSARDEQLLFLPLAHIMGKIMFLTQLRTGGVTTFAENMLRAIDNAAEVHPTFFGAVPRMFEKFYSVANAKAADEGSVKKRLFTWAIDVGHRVARARRKGASPGVALLAQHRYADKLVLSKLRARFGNRLRFAISGGAPLAAELGEWFDAIGITVLEGYGLTETSGATNVNRPGRVKFGTVGPPLDGVENRIAADGEILLRGGGVMKGYWRDPPATEEMIDEEGWLHSGDIGEIDSAGMLRITDRKKDLIVTSAGKNIAPQNIENLLRQSPWVGQCVVVGDQRQYLTVLLTLNQKAMTHWAAENDREPDPEKLSVDPEVLALIQVDVDSVNHRLARFETIKRFHVLPHEFSAAAGELTPTGKVRRSVVTKRYADVIERMYN
ncbi:MAG: long-chain fatty acid--CoA ligase [Deltaproteobacteria bacterium]|nr:long-chain fatty acid--CoA ligase [Deltaproteobacteria bacterium]